jgi:asparagine N-glycosylation enzyme membrane subunit Stt3
MNETLRRTWPAALTGVIALLYTRVGLAADGRDQILGIVGGLVMLVALAAAQRSQPVALVLLVVGTLPLAVATWWSIATPVLAVLALVLGAIAIHNLSRRPKVPAPLTTSNAAT